ncbi:MAG TPA: patatin-like phospholipase family protein [Clostridia bacterium]|nr:patatin-like phospholipase family protein [Clostridia bacterium]
MKDNRPKIGLALGAGASRGLAHIGVLQILEEHGIVPDFIAGSSIGALIGALYAAGISPKMIGGIASELDMKMYYDVGVPRLGFMKGDKLEELIKILTRGRTFNELKIPLKVTAVDLKTNKLVIIDEGIVHRAVRASISIPGIFTPVFDGDQVLVDGGLLERIPTRIVRDMGADIVIGSDVGFMGQHGDASNILGIILQSFEVMELAIINNRICDDDIIIYPKLSTINPLLFDKADECIEVGREATLQAIDKIVDRINDCIAK